MAQRALHGTAWPGPTQPTPSAHSHSPLEMSASLRGAKVGSLGLTMSSRVTAAMALMLVEAVLGHRQVAQLSPSTQLGVSGMGWGDAPQGAPILT